MLFSILALGDAIGSSGTSYLSESRRLRKFCTERKIHLTVVNAENSADGNGTLPQSANSLFEAGADVLTGGNHSFKRREFYTMLDDTETVLRPANMPAAAEGHGYTIVDAGGVRVLVMNLIGCVYMESVTSPFECADRILEREKGRYDISAVDFHAEATSEKLALAHYLTGRVSCIWGTHTHVATADECILGGATGYITDLGMVGSRDGIIGVKPDAVLHKFLVKTPSRFETAHGNEHACGAIFTIDTDSGRCVKAERVEF